jgi:hypothetical protein
MAFRGLLVRIQSPRPKTPGQPAGSQGGAGHCRVFMWNDDLARSQVYRDVQEMMTVAPAKQEELLARGWLPSGRR